MSRWCTPSNCYPHNLCQFAWCCKSQTHLMFLLEVIHCVIQGDNSEHNIGFAVLVDAVDGSDHTTKSLLGSGDDNRNLIPFPRCLWSDVWRQLRLEGKNQRCICIKAHCCFWTAWPDKQPHDCSLQVGINCTANSASDAPFTFHPTEKETYLGFPCARSRSGWAGFVGLWSGRPRPEAQGSARLLWILENKYIYLKTKQNTWMGKKGNSKCWDVTRNSSRCVVSHLKLQF